jgi:hypothetical protein
VFARAGVRCRHVPHQPELDDLADDLEDYMTERLGGMAFDFDDEDDFDVDGFEDDGVDDEWIEWSAALNELIELGQITLRSRNLSRDRMLGRYVGHPDLGAELFGPGAPPHMVAPLAVWSMVCYRPTPRSKTALEIVLERKTISEEVRAIAEALRDATPSLYEVVETRESVIGLRDIATGDVHAEVMLPMPTRVGSIWPGLVHAAGPFELLAPIGPAVPPSCAASVPDTLADWGIAVTHDALARHDWFGGLIAWWVEDADLYDLDDPHDVDDEEEDEGARDPADDRLITVHREMQRRWLDAQIPAFDGSTPREMCRTDEGRRTVFEFIRGLRNPSPRIPDSVHQEVIEDLLTDLGLA